MNEKIWLKKLQTEGHLQYMTKEEVQLNRDLFV